jgi:hypothetical protein
MSKKPLGLNGGSKLASTPSPLDLSQEKKQEKNLILIIKRKKKPIYPKSYRLNQDDTERMKKILKAVNECGLSRIFTETEIIKGLLVIGEKTRSEKIISSIKEAF